MNRGKILIADDEAILTNSLRKILSDAGFTVSVCSEGKNLIQELGAFLPDVVLLDIFLGSENGIQLLEQMKREGWDMPVIIITAYSDVSLAVQAMKVGASDFVVKPFDLNHLTVLIEKNIEHSRLKAKVRILQDELDEQRSRSGIIGNHPLLRRCLDTARKLALSDSTTVLIQGESGTGKELMARYIHQNSGRSGKAFISINCGAIPKDLAESEFFGYEKGAFTGATERMKQGKFELADGGTILLDEVAELSLDMQVKLLRVLEEKKFYRLGGTREISVDVRVIAAANKDLNTEANAGRFREDLLYRLNVGTIAIPPLRQRREDIAALSYSFLQELAHRFSKPVPQLAPEALQILEQLPWKGNVRELRNVIERVVLLHNVPVLTVDAFSFLRDEAPVRGHQQVFDGERFRLDIPRHGVKMSEVLKELILRTLDLTNGNQVQAAKILGVTRSKLRYRMEQLGIEPLERSYRLRPEDVSQAAMVA
jgi:two-component system, NtrC family, response regulator AtoC